MKVVIANCGEIKKAPAEVPKPPADAPVASPSEPKKEEEKVESSANEPVTKAADEPRKSRSRSSTPPLRHDSSDSSSERRHKKHKKSKKIKKHKKHSHHHHH